MLIMLDTAKPACMQPFQQHTIWSINVQRAKHAVEAGQYSKVIQALTCEGLAMASTEVLNEM